MKIDPDVLEERLDAVGEGTLNAIFDNNPNDLFELFETGSITLKTRAGTFLITLTIEEQTH